MTDCIFCKIVKNELPSYKVYEDDNIVAFLDINPVSQGHTLVIPKDHYESIEDASEDKLCRIIETVKKVGQAIKSSMGVSGYNIAVNNGSVAGQLIPHLHFHIMPRTEGDGLKLWPARKYKEGEAEAVKEKIKSNI